MVDKRFIEYLQSKGIKANKKGFRYLYYAIELVCKNNYEVPSLMTCIYPIVAKKTGTTIGACQNCMRRALVDCGYKGISVSEFLANAGIHFMRG